MIPQLPDPDELRLLLPEISLITAMCAVLLVPFIQRKSVALPVVAALGGLLLATLATVANLGDYRMIFSGSLAIDHFSQFFKILLLLFSVLVVVLWGITSRKQTHAYDVPDFLCLLLGAVFGMSLMASATSLIMIFVAIESASLPSYALAGFRKHERVGSEGSLKYIIFGSASSALMVYGMSLIYGSAGTLDLFGVAGAVTTGGLTPLMAVGLAGLFVGLSFKLSAVPLHFWCPDVFQAAPIEVTTFLSVASKGAAVCLLVRVLHVFGVASMGDLGAAGLGGLSVGVAIVGAITATWGNLLALRQTNLKRLLACSSISHAGYMIMAASLIISPGRGSAQSVAGAILFYLLIYLFMNLGAFTAAAIIDQETGQDDIRGYTGLARRCPTLAVLMSLFLLSLFGMPGLGGFMGKIYLMESMTKAENTGFVLITVLLLNTLLSLYYYMRPVYYMVLVAGDERRPVFFPRGIGLAMLLGCAAVLLWTGLSPSAAGGMTQDYARMFSFTRNVVDVTDSLAASQDAGVLVIPPLHETPGR